MKLSRSLANELREYAKLSALGDTCKKHGYWGKFVRGKPKCVVCMNK